MPQPFFHRRSIRLKGYDYTQPGEYFVTIVTHNRESLLGEVSQGGVRLSKYGEIVKDIWETLPQYFPLEVDAFVVMPDHTHGLMMLSGGQPLEGKASASFARVNRSHPGADALPLQSRRGSAPGSISAMVQYLKSVSARRVNMLRRTPSAPVWQRNYFEHIVCDEDERATLFEYIRANPEAWPGELDFSLQTRE